MSKKIILQKKTVTQYLNDVDYSVSNIIPSADALMFSNFIREVNGGSEENETPLMHLSMMDSVFNIHPRNAILSHRGSSKTSLFGEYLTLWKGAFNNIPGFGRTNLSIYVSDSIENGVKNLRRNVEFRFAESDYLKWLIPYQKIKIMAEDNRAYSTKDYDEIMEDPNRGGIRFTDVRMEFENRKKGRHITKMYGILTGIKGVKELGQRPVDATFDDVIKGDDAARSNVILQTVKNSIYKDVAKALHPKRRKMIYVGTPYNQRDPLYEAIESGAWTVSVYPICEDFDANTTKETFKGSWEDRFPFEYVKDEFDTAVAVGQPQSFYQELMLRVTNEEDRLVLDDDIYWYKDSNEIYENKDNYNFYITTDLATGSKEASDFSVISVWAYDHKKVFRYVDGIVKKQTVDKSMDDIFRLNKKWNPEYVSLERQGSQKGFISLFKREMLHRNEYFAIASDKKSGEEGFTALKDKVERFQLALPYFKRKQIRFPKNLESDPRMIEGINELKSISNSGIASKHDDFIDTISHLPLLQVYEPTRETISKKITKQSEESNPFAEIINMAREKENKENINKNYQSYII